MDERICATEVDDLRKDELTKKVLENKRK